MSMSYEDYDRDYNASLSKIRSYLAGNRSPQTMKECERLLGEARNCATAMQGLAEVEGNPNRVMESKQRIERDIGPLLKEVRRQINDMERQEVVGGYQAPNAMEQGEHNDMDFLLQSSDDMLRESLAICADTEEVGTSTLLQMGRQREQLETTSGHIDATRRAAEQASVILRSMGARAFRSRFCLQCTIVVLAFLNLWALIHLFKHKK